jgi:hypothetical protein
MFKSHHDYYLILIIVYASVVFFVRARGVKALRSLSKDDKLKLFDTRPSAWQYLIYVLVLFGGLVLFHYKNLSWLPHPITKSTLIMVYFGYCGLIVLAIAFLQWVRHQKLKKAQLPEHYIRSCLINNGIMLLAILFFIIGIFFNAKSLHGW